MFPCDPGISLEAGSGSSMVRFESSDDHIGSRVKEKAKVTKIGGATQFSRSGGRNEQHLEHNGH